MPEDYQLQKVSKQVKSSKNRTPNNSVDFVTPDSKSSDSTTFESFYNESIDLPHDETHDNKIQLIQSTENHILNNNKSPNINIKSYENDSNLIINESFKSTKEDSLDMNATQDSTKNSIKQCKYKTDVGKTKFKCDMKRIKNNQMQTTKF